MPSHVPSLLLAGLLAGSASIAAAEPSEELRQRIARGDEAYAARAEGARGPRADPGPIGRAVAAYEEALAIDAADPEARWKLMRALYFVGEYTGLDDDARLEVFERGRTLGESLLDALAAPLGGREATDRLEPAELAERLRQEPAAAPAFFWTAVHWGLWGQTRGKLAAARQGVAGKVRDRAEVVIALDELYEAAGGHRVLGRLHAEAPKIPLVTGWVSKQVAVEQLRRAVELAPEEKLNRLYLAEALWQRGRDHRPEALDLLRQLLNEEPQPPRLVEEAKTLADARDLLARVEP